MSFSMNAAVPADTSAPINLDFNLPFGPQIANYFKNLPDLRGQELALPGQAVAAIMCLPVLEMAGGLPLVTCAKFAGRGEPMQPVAVFDSQDFRHNVVRPRRNEIADGEAFEGYTVLDGGGRGLTELQMTELAETLETNVDNIRIISCDMGHIDPANPTEGVVDKLVSLDGMVKSDWTGGRVLYVPPGLGLSATIQATAMFGLSEVWPRTIRLNRHDDGAFHVEELIDVQALRQGLGREVRENWMSGNAPVSIPRELFNQLVETAPEELRAQLLALVE